MKNSSNTSSGESGMATVGPTGEVNGWIVTGASCSDHDCGSGANIEEKQDKYIVMYVRLILTWSLLTTRGLRRSGSVQT